MTPKFENIATDFVKAITTIANKPANLSNLESYLSWNFDKWLEVFARDPANLTAELKFFAEMEI